MVRLVTLMSIDKRPQSPEIRDHAVAVMESMTQHLQQTYMEIAEEDAADSALQDIHKLVRRAREIKMLAA